MATATDTVTTVEEPVAHAPKPIMTHKQIMLVVYGLMSGMFLSSLAQTVFGTAIRTIGDDLHGLDQQAWVTTAFLITSTITTILLHYNGDDSHLKDYLVDNTWAVSEWITLIGFVVIGLEIDVQKFFDSASNNNQGILTAYLVIQGIDILTTLGWAWLVFGKEI